MDHYEDDTLTPITGFYPGDAMFTPDGVVVVIAGSNGTVMHFVHKLVWYHRIWQRSFAERTLITLGKRFAYEKAKES